LAVRIRGDDLTVFGADEVDVRPGDLVVVDSRLAAFTPSTSGATSRFSPPVPVRPDADQMDAVSRVPAADVLHTGAPPVGRVALRLEPGAWPAEIRVEDLLQKYIDTAEDATESARREILRGLLATHTAGQDLQERAGTVKAAIEILSRVRESELLLHLDDEKDAPVRLLVLDRRRAWADERLRQVWLPQRQVPLDEHQAAVADRAAWLAQGVGLPRPLVDALRAAGDHHDEGKLDPRFQAGLCAGETPLAKSGGVSWDEFRRLIKQAGLPERWRHEQRSVVACWDAVRADLPQEYAQLAVRLVGTSHGHGRTGFPHTATTLLDAGDPAAERELAEELFDLGAWDNLIETTHHRWGVWGCAYLEALLRAADGQVSAEGT
jgi:CRISPR-associated endonuclease/helicase Cas3